MLSETGAARSYLTCLKLMTDVLQNTAESSPVQQHIEMQQKGTQVVPSDAAISFVSNVLRGNHTHPPYKPCFLPSHAHYMLALRIPSWMKTNQSFKHTSACDAGGLLASGYGGRGACSEFNGLLRLVETCSFPSLPFPSIWARSHPGEHWEE